MLLSSFGKFFYHRKTLESARALAGATNPGLLTDPHGNMYVMVQTVLCEHLVPINYPSVQNYRCLTVRSGDDCLPFS